MLENFRPGVLDRLGIGYDTVRARNPRVVYCSITGYGQEGRMAGRRAYAPVMHAELGLMEFTARRLHGQPRAEAVSHADLYAGAQATVGILAALVQRDRTGFGQHVDVSMAETMLCVNEHGATNLTGLTEPLPLATSASPLFRTRSGRTVSVAFDPTARGPFAQWLRAMNRPDLASDARFAEEEARRVNRDQLTALIQDWVMEFPDLKSLEAQIQKLLQ